MRNITKEEAIEDIRIWGKDYKKSQDEVDKNINNPPFKEDIDKILEGMPLLKVKKAQKLLDEWNKYNIENAELEQIYRAFYSSFKTSSSYWNFKRISILLMYIYGYILDDELDSLKDNMSNMSDIFEIHRNDMECIKEIDDALRDEKFSGHILMNVSCLAIGANTAFMKTLKAILNVLEKLHTDMDYREGHYFGGTVDWDEAILLKALPHHWNKKGGEIEKFKKMEGEK